MDVKNMDRIFGIDANGFYIQGNDAWKKSKDGTPEGYVMEAPPIEYANPRYVEGAWIDDLLPPPPLTDAERIEALEQIVADLTARVESLENTTP